ncbi:MAG TPA: hypothetical protein VK828_21140 [Terriglobales bacterium]|jgi:hypothetical protein|nr:hypothetical protein [Terriglobales bacterium]
MKKSATVNRDLLQRTECDAPHDSTRDFAATGAGLQSLEREERRYEAKLAAL